MGSYFMSVNTLLLLVRGVLIASANAKRSDFFFQLAEYQKKGMIS